MKNREVIKIYHCWFCSNFNGTEMSFFIYLIKFARYMYLKEVSITQFVDGLIVF
jgi:hypothetical protein